MFCTQKEFIEVLRSGDAGVAGLERLNYLDEYITAEAIALVDSTKLRECLALQLKKLVKRAAYNNDLDTIKMMVPFYKQTMLWDSVGGMSLQTASVRGSVEVIEYLLSAGVPIDSRHNGATSFFIACLLGDLKMARLLLAKGAAIQLASVSPAFAYIQSQLGARHAGAIEIANALHASVCCSNEPESRHAIVSMILEHCPQQRISSKALINTATSEGNYPLFLASNANLTNCAKLLVLAGASIDVASTPSGVNALFAAASRENLLLLKFLIAMGANTKVDPKVAGGQTLLTYIMDNPVYNRFPHPIGRELFSLAASLCREQFGAKSPDGFTVLHLVVLFQPIEYLEIILQLCALDRGDLVNMASNDGATPLHCAALIERPDAVKLLLDAGANPATPTHAGDYACQFGCAKQFMEYMLNIQKEVGELRKDLCRAVYAHVEHARPLLPTPESQRRSPSVSTSTSTTQTRPPKLSPM